MKKVLLVFLLLFVAQANAQSIPNGNTPLQQNQVWTPAQWNSAWQAKADTTKGVTVAAVTCDGTTDDATAINSAITAANSAGGGIVHLPEGVCAVGSTIVMQTGVTLEGAGRYATTIEALASMSGTTDLIQTSGYAALTGTATNSGPYMWAIKDLTIEGNKFNRTGTGGRDVAIFGYDYVMSDLNIVDCPGDCVDAAWGNETTTPGPQVITSGARVPLTGGGYTFSSTWDHVIIMAANGNGLTYDGPSDSYFNILESFGNVGFGFLFQDLSTGASVTNSFLHQVHAYGNGTWGIGIDGLIQVDGVESESNLGSCKNSPACPGFSPSGGGGIVVLATSGHGQINGSHVFTWGNPGDGIDFNNGGYGGTTGNSISDLQSYSNDGNGIGVDIGYSSPPTTLSNVVADKNGGDGVNTCLAGTSGGAGLIIAGLDASNNTYAGVGNCMQQVNITGAALNTNGTDGYFETGTNPALITFIGQAQGNATTNVAFGTLGLANNIQMIVYSSGTEGCWTGTPGSANNVIIVCSGPGTGANSTSLFATTGTFTNNGTAVTVP